MVLLLPIGGEDHAIAKLSEQIITNLLSSYAEVETALEKQG